MDPTGRHRQRPGRHGMVWRSDTSGIQDGLAGRLPVLPGAIGRGEALGRGRRRAGGGGGACRIISRPGFRGRRRGERGGRGGRRLPRRARREPPGGSPCRISSSALASAPAAVGQLVETAVADENAPPATGSRCSRGARARGGAGWANAAAGWARRARWRCRRRRRRLSGEQRERQVDRRRGRRRRRPRFPSGRRRRRRPRRCRCRYRGHTCRVAHPSPAPPSGSAAASACWRAAHGEQRLQRRARRSHGCCSASVAVGRAAGRPRRARTKARPPGRRSRIGSRPGGAGVAAAESGAPESRRWQHPAHRPRRRAGVAVAGRRGRARAPRRHVRDRAARRREEVALAEDARGPRSQLDVPRVGAARRRRLARRRRDAQRILGLDVAVDDPQRVEALDGREELADYRHRLGLDELRAHRDVVHQLAAVRRLERMSSHLPAELAVALMYSCSPASPQLALGLVLPHRPRSSDRCRAPSPPAFPSDSASYIAERARASTPPVNSYSMPLNFTGCVTSNSVCPSSSWTYQCPRSPPWPRVASHRLCTCVAQLRQLEHEEPSESSRGAGARYRGPRDADRPQHLARRAARARGASLLHALVLMCGATARSTAAAAALLRRRAAVRGAPGIARRRDERGRDGGGARAAGRLVRRGRRAPDRRLHMHGVVQPSTAALRGACRRRGRRRQAVFPVDAGARRAGGGARGLVATARRLCRDVATRLASTVDEAAERASRRRATAAAAATRPSRSSCCSSASR